MGFIKDPICFNITILIYFYMKKLFFFLFLFCTIASYLNSQTILVKLNPLDCVNCNFLLPKLVNNYPSSKIVLEETYKKQHKSIEKLLGSKNYQSNLVYSDSLYNKINHKNQSEVVIVSELGDIILREDLKEVNLNSFKELISNDTSNSNVILCDESIQEFTAITTFNNYYILRNLITNELAYSYNNKPSSLVEINTEEITSKIFIENLKDTTGLSLYNYYKDYPNIKSALTSFLPLTTEEWYGLYEITHISIQNSHDTMFRNKLFLIHSLNNNLSIYNLESSSGTYFLQYALHYWKNKLYIRTFKSEYDINNLPNILGEIEIENLKNKTAKIHDIDDYVLDPELIKFGINYSLPIIISSHQFVMYPLSSKIYNLDTRKSIEIPHINQYLAENKVFKEEDKLPFLTYDMKYRKNDESICLLYEFNENLYYSVFKLDGKIIIKHQQILSNKYWDSTKVIFLSEDGNYLHYIPLKENCIKTIKI